MNENFFMYVLLPIAFLILFISIVYTLPEETPTYKECKKLQNIKEVYNNLSLKQKDYIYNNCI